MTEKEKDFVKFMMLCSVTQEYGAYIKESFMEMQSNLPTMKSLSRAKKRDELKLIEKEFNYIMSKLKRLAGNIEATFPEQNEIAIDKIHEALNTIEF